MEPEARAESPIMKLDFVNNVQNEGVDSTAPQPGNHELAERAAPAAVDGTVIAPSRAGRWSTRSCRTPATFFVGGSRRAGERPPLDPVGDSTHRIT